MRIQETNEIMNDAKARQDEVQPEPADLRSRLKRLGERARTDGRAWLEDNRSTVGAVTAGVLATAGALLLRKRRKSSYKWYDPRRMRS